MLMTLSYTFIPQTLMFLLRSQHVWRTSQLNGSLLLDLLCILGDASPHQHLKAKHHKSHQNEVHETFLGCNNNQFHHSLVMLLMQVFLCHLSGMQAFLFTDATWMLGQSFVMSQLDSCSLLFTILPLSTRVAGWLLNHQVLSSDSLPSEKFPSIYLSFHAFFSCM